MAENRIKYMSWTEFDRRRKETDLAVIPSGAIEVYGPHLPLGSDIIVAEEVSRMLAERVPAVVGPSVEIGDSRALAAFPGTLVARPESLKAVYEDVCRSFVRWGFRRFFFVNTHVGNVAPLNQLAEGLQEAFGVRCAAIDWWRFVQPLSEGVVETAHPHGHASETGTSVLLYLAPEYVDMSRAPVVEPRYEDAYPDVFKYPDFDAYTPNGTIGDATAGSSEKGQRIVERAVDRMARFVETAFSERSRSGHALSPNTREG
jgi:creatinine amidohydrolase